MSKRFVTMAIALALALWSAYLDLQAHDTAIFHVFFWLLIVLAIAGIGLWPSTGRDQRAELALERLGWADRINFDSPSAASITPAEAVSHEKRSSARSR